MTAQRIHGGADVPWDFSTNTNALGPCQPALSAVLQADRQRYPDASYQALIQSLADWHGVSIERILLGGSSSELIQRFHVALRMLGAGAAGVVAVATPSYGDYEASALACGFRVIRQEETEPIDLEWHTVPSSPLGHNPSIEVLLKKIKVSMAMHVIDAAYQPLLLEGEGLPKSALDIAWSIWTPNKALGLCGMRGAYAIAPLPTAVSEPFVDKLRELEPSWVLSAEAQVLLGAWVSEPAQGWLAESLESLRELKTKQLCMLAGLSIEYQASVSNFFVVQLSSDRTLHAHRLQALLAKGVALRDTQSMGLPGWARMRVHTAEAQAAFEGAWKEIT